MNQVPIRRAAARRPRWRCRRAQSADTLRIVFRAVTNVDPHNQLRTGLVIAHQAWDCLIYHDPDTFAPKPLLATAWKIVDTTIEFTLRQGVKFLTAIRSPPTTSSIPSTQ